MAQNITAARAASLADQYDRQSEAAHRAWCSWKRPEMLAAYNRARNGARLAGRIAAYYRDGSLFFNANDLR